MAANRRSSGGRPRKASQARRPRQAAQPAGRSGQRRGGGSATNRTSKAAGQPRPLPAAQSFFTAGASPTRRSIEHASAPLLVAMHRLPRPVVGLAPLVLLLLGLFLPLAAGVVALVLAVLLLAWLAYLSWPAVDARGRLVRLIGVALPIIVLAARAGDLVG